MLKIDKIIFFISLFGILFFSIFLYAEDWRFIQLIEDDGVATVLDYKNSVKRKQSNSVVWSKVVKGTILYAGDDIMTGKNSSVDILFKDKITKISVPAKSLFRVGMANENNVISGVFDEKVEYFWQKENTYSGALLLSDSGLAPQIIDWKGLRE